MLSDFDYYAAHQRTSKIFVEVERARLTRILSKIREEEGKIAEACDILQDLQVSRTLDAFGSWLIIVFV